jgi:hypothetical protein
MRSLATMWNIVAPCEGRCKQSRSALPRRTGAPGPERDDVVCLDHHLTSTTKFLL